MVEKPPEKPLERSLADIEQLSFERAIEELETIVKRLEEG